MFIDACGVEVHVQQRGSGAHVLLLHGWGCSVKHFEPIFNALSQDRCVTAIDFPGHGQTPEPPMPWGVPEFARMTVSLINTLHLAPVSIIAHSFGARVAIYIAGEHPELVDKLILTGAAGLIKPKTPEQQRRAEAYQKKKRLLEAFKRVPLIKGAASKLEDKLRQKYGSVDYNALSASMRQTFVKVVNQDLGQYLPRITAPTLLVFGEKDEDTPLWMGQRMEKEIKDAGLVVFENDDHFAYLRQWQRFVKIVDVFLKS